MSSTLRLILFAAALLAVAALVPYLYMFRAGLSASSQDWSNFGSYVGGTLGPIYALLAFAAGVQTILDNRHQAVRQSLLATVQRYEGDFEEACTRTVSCESPWVWGNMPNDTHSMKMVAFRTLLYSDPLDWEQHLPPLVVGHGFQVLPSGEISQDREVVLQAQLAIDGLFKYLAMYKAAGGDKALVSYLESRYEIPKNRIEVATQHAAERIDIDA